jgi:hypothetical protein
MHNCSTNVRSHVPHVPTANELTRHLHLSHSSGETEASPRVHVPFHHELSQNLSAHHSGLPVVAALAALPIVADDVPIDLPSDHSASDSAEANANGERIVLHMPADIERENPTHGQLLDHGEQLLYTTRKP